MDVTRIKIDPAIIYWGEQQVQKVTCVGTVTAGAYFKLQTAKGAKYAVWYEVGGSGSAPSVSGYTNVKVTVGATPTASAVATATETALGALGGLVAKASGADVEITDGTIGAADPAADGTATTGFTFAVETEGFGGDLGYTSGDTEFKPTVETKEITAHQSGNSPLGELITKVSVDKISLTLMEADKARIKEMFSAIGHSEKPALGTEAVGLGTKAVGGSLFAGAKRLVFHPKSKADTDRTEDVYFPKAAPVPGSMKFSGTDERTLTVDFSIYPDPALIDEMNILIYGDWAQPEFKKA